MTLDNLNAKINSLRDQADQIQQSYSQRIADLGQDTSMSNSGRQSVAEQAATNAEQRLQALEAEETAAIEAERLRLVRRIAGTVGDDAASVIGFRDAQDRAAEIRDPVAANALMTRALNSGDTQLASAMLSQALDLGFTAAINAYVERHPESAADIQDLAAVERWRSSIETTFSTGLAYLLPHRPVALQAEGTFRGGMRWGN